MVHWVLPPSLASLRREFNAIAPKRDKTSDGSIGDQAHSKRASDHNPDETGITAKKDTDSKNEIHAIDVDKNLRKKFTMQDVVNFILNECRKPKHTGKDKGRLRYIIFDGKIYEAPHWRPKRYAGANKHTEHAHFSAEYVSKYAEDGSTWGLIEKFGQGVEPKRSEEIEMPLTDADIEKIAKAVWNYQLGIPPDNKKTRSAGGTQRYADARHENTQKVVKDEVAKVLKAMPKGTSR